MHSAARLRYAKTSTVNLSLGGIIAPLIQNYARTCLNMTSHRPCSNTFATENMKVTMGTTPPIAVTGKVVGKTDGDGVITAGQCSKGVHQRGGLIQKFQATFGVPADITQFRASLGEAAIDVGTPGLG